MRSRASWLPMSVFVLLIMMGMTADPAMYVSTGHMQIPARTPSAPPSDGDWIITDTTTLNHATFTMKGRIIIEDGGFLTLSSCNVEMYSRADWYPAEDVAYIWVKDGGRLSLESTHIYPGTNYRWYLEADGGSIVDINGCELESVYPGTQDSDTATLIGCGGWPTYEPCEHVTIVSNNIHDNRGPAIMVNAIETDVCDNQITRVMGYGIYIQSAPNGEVKGNRLDEVSGDPWGGRGIGIIMSDLMATNVSLNVLTDIEYRGFDWRTYAFEGQTSPPLGPGSFIGNTVDGETVSFFCNEEDLTVDPEVSGVMVHRCQNVTIRDMTASFITVTWSDDVSIANCTIDDGEVTAVYCSDLYVVANHVSDTDYRNSFDISRCEYATIENNTITGGGDYSSSIYLRWSSHIAVSRNTMESCQAVWAIACLDNAYARIEENTMIDSAVNGIAVWRCTNVVVLDNVINGTTGGRYNPYSAESQVGFEGIDVSDSHGTVVRNNTIVNAIGGGMYIGRSNDVVVQDNFVAHSPARAITLDTCLRTSFDGNVFENVSWMGIAVLECRNASFVDNAMIDVEGPGYYVYQKSPAARILTFTNNTQNGRPFLLYQDTPLLRVDGDIAGVVLLNCSDSMIADIEGVCVGALFCDHLTVRDCDLLGGGLNARYCTNMTVACCRVTTTEGYNVTRDWGYVSWRWNAMRFDFCDDLTVIRNLVNGTGNDGICAVHCVPARIVSNTILDSGRFGISLYSTRENLVTGNVINLTGVHGLYVYQSSKCQIYLNSFGLSTYSPVRVDYVLDMEWNNGTHGNYYQDYTGTDGNGDGIGDTPYQVWEGQTDTCPLVDTVFVGQHRTELCLTSPQITSASLQADSGGNVTIIVVANATYGIGEAIFSYSTDGGATWTNISLGYNYTCWLGVVPHLASGSILWRVYVRDNIGNWATSEVETADFSNMVLILSATAIVGVGVAVTLGVFLRRRK